jgi:hypothetical protein
VLTGRGHALLIAVSKYDKDAWPELRSVIADIDDLKKGLAPHFTTIETLINPKSDIIRNKLREFMTGQWNKPDERLLVYYAGHGFTDYNINSRTYTGYITGSDTPACHGTDCDSAIGNAIPFNYIDGLNRETRARQVLTLFDSCFSGLVAAKGPDDAEATHYAADRAREEIRKPIRYYITAGGPAEKVPANSPFASLILKGLNGAADFWKDGFISAEELGVYLQRSVPVHAKLPLHPVRSAIADETARLSSGQFMFLTGLTALPMPPHVVSSPNTLSPNKADKATTVEECWSQWLNERHLSDGLNKRKGSPIFVAQGFGTVTADKGNQNIIAARSAAFNQAELAAKKAISEYVGVEIRSYRTVDIDRSASSVLPTPLDVPIRELSIAEDLNTLTGSPWTMQSAVSIPLGTGRVKPKRKGEKRA